MCTSMPPENVTVADEIAIHLFFSVINPGVSCLYKSEGGATKYTVELNK